MNFKPGDMIYEGKAKKIFQVVNSPNYLWHEFKNSLTAFNGVKKSEFNNKGSLNQSISAEIFLYLKSKNILSHYIDSVANNIMITQKLEMIPLEVVVRNISSGSFSKRLNFENGKVLKFPIVEFYYKKDELNDPLVTEDHILVLNILNNDQIQKIKKLALEVNFHLKDFFKNIDVDLVDFKIEFGFDSKSEILLADEISPDSCRLWDSNTQKKLDKDVFRLDLGSVEEVYLEIFKRIEDFYKKKGNV